MANVTAVIMPIFEDSRAAAKLMENLNAEVNANLYIIAIDDGSVKEPVKPALLIQAGLNGVVIKLKRNLGHQRAIAVGISYAAKFHKEKNCIVMDSDGEDTPASVAELIDFIEKSEAEVVVATRKSRVETLKFKLFYVVYKAFFMLMTGRKISFGNFMALKPAAVQRLAVMQETWIHVASSILVSRLTVEKMPADRGARYQGRSKMNFTGLVLHGFRALMVFAEDVLVRVGLTCAFVAALTLTAIIMTIFLKIISFATPGWFSIALGVLFLVLLQTGALTLMTLMLTGIMRGGMVLVDDFESLIDEVETI